MNEYILELDNLFNFHNSKCLDIYQSRNLDVFENWIFNNYQTDGNDNYIEISSNETLNNVPIILDLNLLIQLNNEVK